MMRRRAVLAGVVVLAVLPANAGAAEFGGGAIVGSPTGFNRGVVEQIVFKAPRSLPGRMTVAIEVDNLRCPKPAFGQPANGRVTTGVNRFRGVKVARDGTFSATLALDQTAPTGEKSKGRSTLKGKLRGASASGTISSFVNVTDPNGAPKTRCELAPTRWFAETATRVSRDRLARPDGRRYFGVNDTRSATDKTRWNVIVNLTRSRKRGAMVVAYNARCGDPKEPVFEQADYSPIFSVRDGKFSAGETFDSGDPAGPGFATRVTTRYAGAFVRGGARGTLRIRLILFQDGKEIDRCDTGKVKWRALRP